MTMETTEEYLRFQTLENSAEYSKITTVFVGGSQGGRMATRRQANTGIGD